MQNYTEPYHVICRSDNACRRVSPGIHPDRLSSSVRYCLSEGQLIKLLGHETHSTNNMQLITSRCKSYYIDSFNIFFMKCLYIPANIPGTVEPIVNRTYKTPCSCGTYILVIYFPTHHKYLLNIFICWAQLSSYYIYYFIMSSK